MGRSLHNSEAVTHVVPNESTHALKNGTINGFLTPETGIKYPGCSQTSLGLIMNLVILLLLLLKLKRIFLFKLVPELARCTYTHKFIYIGSCVNTHMLDASVCILIFPLVIDFTLRWKNVLCYSKKISKKKLQLVDLSTSNDCLTFLHGPIVAKLCLCLPGVRRYR